MLNYLYSYSSSITNFLCECIIPAYINAYIRRDAWIVFSYWDNFIERYPRTDCHWSLYSCSDTREHNGSDPRSFTGIFSSLIFFFYFILLFTSFLHFFSLVFFSVLIPSCWFRVIKHTQREMTRCNGRISSHDSDRTRVIEIYTHTRTPQRWHPIVVDR